MAAPNLMDDALLEALMKGDSVTFKHLLKNSDSENVSPRPVIIDMPSEPESEAHPDSTPRGVAVCPIIKSMLLRRVTPAGDGVLHIASRHGHLNLVSVVFHEAGMEANPEGEEAMRGATEEQCRSFTAKMMTGLRRCVKSCLRVGDAATGEVVPAAESSAASSSWPHGENAAQGQGEAEIHEEDEPPRLLPSPAQHRDHEDDAAEQGSTIKFVELLRARNNRGETCLHEAIRWGHTMIARKLIEGDARLEDETTPPLVAMMDEDGASPLYLATTLRRYDIVEYLTDKKYKYSHRVSAAGPAGRTALHAAVLLDKDLCKTLLEWDKSLAKRKDQSGDTPLHYFGTSDTAITEAILDKDASSGNYTGSKGSLPIHVAASRGRLDVIKKLVKNEGCRNCESSCNDDGQTFLHVAVLNGQVKIVKYVCTDPKFAHLLNMRDKNGDTALHLAVQKGQEYIFCYLFGNKEVCLNFINKEGHTPLDRAFLSIESDHVFKQAKREWILNDLLVAGADFCTCRWDRFSSSGIKETTDEKESEKLSKSAALIATGAALIFSISFAAPFTIANKNLPMTDGDGDGSHGIMYSAQERAECFKNLVEFDAFSLTASSFAIFFCMIAGFHTSRIWTRSVALLLGGSFLYAAAQEILMVFAMGLSQVYPRKMAPHVIWFVIIALNVLCLAAAISTLHLRRVMAHVRARCRRLGVLGSLRSLFRFPSGVSAIPQWHIALYIALLAAWIVNNRYLFTSKSMSMFM